MASLAPHESMSSLSSHNLGFSQNVPVQQSTPNRHPQYQYLIQSPEPSKYHQASIQYDPIVSMQSPVFAPQYHSQSDNVQTSPQNEPYPQQTLVCVPQDSFISPPTFIKQEAHLSQLYQTFPPQDHVYYGREIPMFTSIKQEYLPQQLKQEYLSQQPLYQIQNDNQTFYSHTPYNYNPIETFKESGASRHSNFAGNTHNAYTIKFEHTESYDTTSDLGSSFDSSLDYESPRQNEKVTKFRLNNQYDWIEGSPNLPTGWKIKNISKTNKIYMAPNGKMFYSRSEAFKFMEKELIEDSSSKTPKLERRKSEEYSQPKLHTINTLSSGRSARFPQSPCLNLSQEKEIYRKKSSKASGRRRSEKNPYNETPEDFMNGTIYSEWSCDDDTLPYGWKKRSYKEPTGRYTKFQFLSPHQELFLTRSSVAAYMKASHRYTKEEINRVTSGTPSLSNYSQNMMAKINSIKDEYSYDNGDNFYFNGQLNLNDYLNTNDHFNIKQEFNINDHFNVTQGPNMKEHSNINDQLNMRQHFDMNDHFSMKLLNDHVNINDQFSMYQRFNANNIDEHSNTNENLNKSQAFDRFDELNDEIEKSSQEGTINEQRNNYYHDPRKDVTEGSQIQGDEGEQQDYETENMPSKIDVLKTAEDNENLEEVCEAEFSDWILDTTLPDGWKVRSKEIEDEVMQTQYLSPSGKFLKSRKEAKEYIEMCKKLKEDLKKTDDQMSAVKDNEKEVKESKFNELNK